MAANISTYLQNFTF